MVSIAVLKSFMNDTAPELLPLSVTALPLGRSSPKYPEVPPPILVCIITSPSLCVIPSILSGTCTLKQEMGNPRSVPRLAQMGELKLIQPLSIISLKADLISGLYKRFAAAVVILSIAPSTVSPFSKYPLLRICSLSSLSHHNLSISYQFIRYRIIKINLQQ